MIFFTITIPTKNYRHATTEHNTFFLKNSFIFIQKNAFLIMKSNIICYCEQRSFGYSRLAIPLKVTNHSLIFVVLTEPKLKPIIRPTTPIKWKFKLTSKTVIENKVNYSQVRENKENRHGWVRANCPKKQHRDYVRS